MVQTIKLLSTGGGNLPADHRKAGRSSGLPVPYNVSNLKVTLKIAFHLPLSDTFRVRVLQLWSPILWCKTTKMAGKALSFYYILNYAHQPVFLCYSLIQHRYNCVIPIL